MRRPQSKRGERRVAGVVAAYTPRPAAGKGFQQEGILIAQITLAALCNDRAVHYPPIDYLPRIGDSKIRAVHAFEFLMLVLRTVVYFNPLKVFIPAGGIFFAFGIAKLIYDIYIGNLSETVVLAFLGGGILWTVGMLSDQIAKMGFHGRRS